jgi:hypothetical protein
LIFLMLAACGLSKADFPDAYAAAYCPVAMDCLSADQLEVLGWAEEGDCEVTIADGEAEKLASQSCEVYDDQEARACVEATGKLTCDHLSSGEAPPSCTQVCHEE